MKNINVFSGFLTFWFAAALAGTISSIEDANKENVRKLTLANNELAFKLHRRLSNGFSENVFFSPLSISMTLGMLFYGARGNTAEELRKTLGYERADLPNNLVHYTFYSYLKELSRGNTSDGYVLNAANAVLIDEKFGLLDQYRRNVQELYKATVQDVDFMGKSALIIKTINDCVREKTNGKINKVLDKLDLSTVLLLLNAVYFKGTWKTKFLPEKTKDGIFYSNGRGSEGRVPFMHLRSRFPYASTDAFQAMELPYKGGNVSMLILLPKQRDGLLDLEETVTPEKLDDIQRLMRNTVVEVSLPKFKLQFQKELSPEVQALGAKQIFSHGADFSGMASRNNVVVSEVFHKAVIEVNEEGNEAAAITRSGAVVKSSRGRKFGPPQFKADHPFLFAILEKGSSNSSMILFLGRVNNL